MPVTNMPIICQIQTTHANYFVCRYETSLSLHVPHIHSLQWTMCLGALVYMHSTLQAHATDQICLPSCTCISHCISTVVYMQTPHLFTTLLLNMCQPQIYVLNVIYNPYAKITRHTLIINWEVCQYICHIWNHWHQPCDTLRDNKP